jgi:hypothetical protein
LVKTAIKTSSSSTNNIFIGFKNDLWAFGVC